MKNILFFITALFFSQLNAQVGIGTTSPDPSSVLDVNSNSQGVLLPRLTTIERNGISSPEISLLIYNTTTNQYQYNNGTMASPK